VGNLEATSSPGWNPSFDSQIVIGPIGLGGNAISFNGRSYITIDGQTDNGIKFTYDPNSDCDCATSSGPQSIAVKLGGSQGVICRYMEFAGAQRADAQKIAITGGDSSGNGRD